MCKQPRLQQRGAGPQDAGPCLTHFSLALANAEVFLHVSSLSLIISGVPSPLLLGLAVWVPFAQRYCIGAAECFPLASRALYFSSGPAWGQTDASSPQVPGAVLRCMLFPSRAGCQGRAQDSFLEVLRLLHGANARPRRGIIILFYMTILRLGLPKWC